MNRTHGSLASYTTGFVVSVGLTVAAFWSAANYSGNALVVLLSALAFVQLFIQLVLFLHVGRERGAKWNTLVFGFMGLIVIIVVAGSWWIMANLNYHMTSSSNLDGAIMNEERIQR